MILCSESPDQSQYNRFTIAEELSKILRRFQDLNYSNPE